jgi:hypothetical protein
LHNEVIYLISLNYILQRKLKWYILCYVYFITIHTHTQDVISASYPIKEVIDTTGQVRALKKRIRSKEKRILGISIFKTREGKDYSSFLNPFCAAVIKFLNLGTLESKEVDLAHSSGVTRAWRQHQPLVRASHCITTWWMASYGRNM